MRPDSPQSVCVALRDTQTHTLCRATVHMPEEQILGIHIILFLLFERFYANPLEERAFSNVNKNTV